MFLKSILYNTLKVKNTGGLAWASRNNFCQAVESQTVVVNGRLLAKKLLRSYKGFVKSEILGNKKIICIISNLR